MDYKDNLMDLKGIEQFVTATKKSQKVYLHFLPIKKKQRYKPLFYLLINLIDNFHSSHKDFFSIHPVPALILRGNNLYIYLGISVAVM